MLISSFSFPGRGGCLVVLALALAGDAAAFPLVVPEVVAANVGVVEKASVDGLVIFKLAASPDIEVFDFPSLEQQGRTFNRIVALIERQGQGLGHGKVLSDEELAAAIHAAGKRTATFAFGNDFRASELARFFTLAERGQIELNDDEKLLMTYLLEHGFMRHRKSDFVYVPPDRVILSLPHEQGRDGPDHIVISHATRNAILRHEVSHGEFYDNDNYANYCERFWNEVLDDRQRDAFRAFLGSMNYDVRNEELMINETQAYLFHTPDPRIFSAEKVHLAPSEVDELRQKFWAGPPPSRLLVAEWRAQSRADRAPPSGRQKAK
jgi:hypothetical protein